MNMQENFEVFRFVPEIHKEKCYEHAEYMTKTGCGENERYFTTTPPRYVGHKIKYESGGERDGGWQTDYFENEFGHEIAVPYSYEGKTSFREVECRPRIIPTLEEMSRTAIQKNMTQSDIQSLPHVFRTVLEKDYGGAMKKSKKRISKKRNTRRKKRRNL